MNIEQRLARLEKQAGSRPMLIIMGWQDEFPPCFGPECPQRNVERSGPAVIWINEATCRDCEKAAK